MEEIIKYLDKISKVPAIAIQSVFVLSKNRIFGPGKGFDAENKPLKPYSPGYEEFKQTIGWIGPRPDFYVSGDLFRGYIFDRQNLTAGASNSDSAYKIAKLENRQKGEIFELSKQEIKDLDRIIQKEMEKIKL